LESSKSVKEKQGFRRSRGLGEAGVYEKQGFMREAGVYVRCRGSGEQQGFREEAGV
jgi:hypothetical protein